MLNLAGSGKKEQGVKLTNEFVATQPESRSINMSRHKHGAPKPKLDELLRQLKEFEGGKSLVPWLGGADGESLPRPWIGGWVAGPAQLVSDVAGASLTTAMPNDAADHDPLRHAGPRLAQSRRLREAPKRKKKSSHPRPCRKAIHR